MKDFERYTELVKARKALERIATEIAGVGWILLFILLVGIAIAIASHK